DPDLYRLPPGQAESGRLNGLSLNFGLGFEFYLEKGYIFTEGKLALPANTLLGGLIGLGTLPPNIRVSAGYRIPLFP
nr:hypothetical protein [Bacteroidota bacterium]